MTACVLNTCQNDSLSIDMMEKTGTTTKINMDTMVK